LALSQPAIAANAAAQANRTQARGQDRAKWFTVMILGRLDIVPAASGVPARHAARRRRCAAASGSAWALRLAACRRGRLGTIATMIAER
jgi:hypothetical protein